MKINKIIKKSFDTLEEGITSGQSIVWHRTKKEYLPLIQKNGYLIGNGSAVGAGIYACFEFESQLTSFHRKNYGDVIVECKVKSLDGFIILSPQEAENVYGKKNAKLDNQLRKVFDKKIYDQVKIKLTNKICTDIDNKKQLTDGGNFFNAYLKDFTKYFDGLVYVSKADGLAIVCYNKDNIIPLRYTEDESVTWKPMFNKDVNNRDKSKLNNDKNREYRDLSSSEIYKLLVKDSTLVSELLIHKLSSEDIIDMYTKNKWLFDNLDFRNIDETKIRKIVEAYPELADKFDLTLLNTAKISKLIITHPELIDKFSKEVLSNMEMVYIKKILDVHPTLEKYFDASQINSLNEMVKRININIFY